MVQQPYSFVSLSVEAHPSSLIIRLICMFIPILQHILRVRHSSFRRYNLLRRSSPSLIHSSCSKSPIMRWKPCEGHSYYAIVLLILVKVESMRVSSHWRVAELLQRICSRESSTYCIRQKAFSKMYRRCTRLLHVLYVTSLAWLDRSP